MEAVATTGDGPLVICRLTLASALFRFEEFVSAAPPHRAECRGCATPPHCIGSPKGIATRDP